MINTRRQLNTLTDINLAKYKLWSIEGDRRGDVINCLHGRLWITQEGDLKDYIVEAGKSFWVTRPGTVVVQALENSQFKYSLDELQSPVGTSQHHIRRTLPSRLSQHLR